MDQGSCLRSVQSLHRGESMSPWVIASALFTRKETEVSKLVEFNTKALLRIEEHNTQSLNDFSIPRSEMATASEIGGCARKIVMDMNYPVSPSGCELRQKRRGHIFEIDQAERLTIMGFREVSPKEFRNAKAPCFCRQLALEEQRFSVGCHNDFTIRHRDSTLQVIEGKTTGAIPEKAYPNWLDQHHVQLGLTAFNFPGVPIRGSILVVDLNKGEEVEFNGFTPNKELYEFLSQDVGGHIIAAKRREIEPRCTMALYCGSCDFRAGCPAFEMPEVELPVEVLEAAEEHLKAHTEKKDAEKRLKKASYKLEQFGFPFFKGKVGDLEMSVITVADSTIIDTDKLKDGHPELFLDDTYKKPKDGYVKVEVKRVKPKKIAEKIDKKAA